MFICGSNFVGGTLACAITPTAIENIDYIELKNGLYDDLYITKATDFEITGQLPEEWDFDTVLWAKFNNSTNAGNIDWSLETTSHLILKIREQNSFIWKTILTKEINTLDDFVINYPDYFIASGQPCEYAIVPVFYGTEGEYAISRITPKFQKMFLIEGNTVWGTEITDGFCDTTRNIPSSTIELLNSKYPIFVRNTIANYDTGTCKGSFVPVTEENECEGEYDEANNLINQHEGIYGYFADFLNVLEKKIYSLQGHILTKEKKQPIIFYDEEERFPIDELHIIYNDYDDTGSHEVLSENTNEILSNYNHDEIVTMVGGYEEDMSTIYLFSDSDEQESIEDLLIFWEEEKEPPDANIDTIWI
ncbi:MAG: hypothetical protein J1E64_10705 [Acetatifactor sp.]|nr:hypothetical protein [Acetatifactor sp.]